MRGKWRSCPTVRVGGVSIRIDSKGYLVIKSGFYRDVRLHRIVAAGMLGMEVRDLPIDMDVHHEDANKINFQPENLKFLTKAEHGWRSAIQHWFVPRIIADREHRQWAEWFGGGGDLDAE